MSRPFDLDRDGMVLGEGAGAMILESLEHAENRGAKIYGEVIGGASSAVGPTRGRDFIRQAVKNTLEMLLDRFPQVFSKTMAFACHRAWRNRQRRFGAMAFATCLVRRMLFCRYLLPKAISAIWEPAELPVELIASCLALERGMHYETLNYKTPDPKCPLPIAPAGSPAGEAFVHLSYSPQGQASAVLVSRMASLQGFSLVSA